MLSTSGDVDFFDDLNLPWVGFVLYRGEKFTAFLSYDVKLNDIIGLFVCNG